MNDTAKDWRAERNEQNAKIDVRLAELGLTIAATFVPASHFKDDEWKSKAINFHVNVWIDYGKARRADIYSGPYAYGVGCLPGYRHDRATKMLRAPVVEAAIETGKWPQDGLKRDPSHFGGGKLSTVSAPKLRDVMHSLLMDSSAIDHPSFESWAADFGYDTDSRSAEKTYRACLETGLRLRAVLGDETLAELRELFQDY